jgi:hypothetical protein
MLEWRHGGGFSVDASVCIEANDRAGLERLIRYCAQSKPSFLSTSIWAMLLARIYEIFPLVGPFVEERWKSSLSSRIRLPCKRFSTMLVSR